VLVRDGSSRCAKHKHVEKRTIDKQRASSTQRGYGSRWQKARATYISHNPACVQCGSEVGLVVDHIVPHKRDQTLFWDTSNWQTLCKRCHDAKTAREDGGFGN
jgi:5-methylcytosine-specific restriction enzyme A